MKEKDVLRAISDIDDKYLAEVDATITRQGPVRLPRLVKMGIGAAVALVVAAILILVPYLSIPRDKADENGFVVDVSGCLTAYTGNDETVIFPANVISVAAGVFEEAPAAHKIRTVILNDNVSSIDETAFYPLTSLEEIKVSEGNPYYTFSDGFLKKKDGTIYFGLISTGKDSQDFSDAIEMLLEQQDADAVTKMVIGQYVFNVTFEADATGHTSASMNSVTAKGHTKTFEPAVRLKGNLLMKFFETNDAFVIAQIAHGQNSFWVFNADGVHEFSCKKWFGMATKDVGYLESTYTLDMRDDGKLGYTRYANKFTYEQLAYHALSMCVSRDEFCKETGYVTIENGKFVFYPEKTYTVSQVFDLDAMFSAWSPEGNDNNIDFFEFYGVPHCRTLDDLLEYNAGKYEIAK